MTTITTEVVRIDTSRPIIALKGRGKAARELAYVQIAALSFIENISRVESIANLAVALGKAPTEAELKAAQTEWSIGRVASRLPAGEFPQGAASDDSARIEFARKIVCEYAAPPQPGKKERPLRKGQTGRRSVTQHRVVRAADEAWSQVKAELGLGAAKTQAQKNGEKAAKRSTNSNPVKGDGKADKATFAQLATPAAPTSPADYVNHMTTQLASLVAYDKKNAAKRPTCHGEFAEALAALNKLAIAAATTFQARIDAATGK